MTDRDLYCPTPSQKQLTVPDSLVSTLAELTESRQATANAPQPCAVCGCDEFYSYLSTGIPLKCVDCEPPQLSRVKTWRRIEVRDGAPLLCEFTPTWLNVKVSSYDPLQRERELAEMTRRTDQIMATLERQASPIPEPACAPLAAKVWYITSQGKMRSCGTKAQIPAGCRWWTYEGAKCWWERC